MSHYRKTASSNWNGRKSGLQLYLHEKVSCIDLEETELDKANKKIALLGYSCDEGVKRNQGRVGAVDGPDAIRKQLAKMPNHLGQDVLLIDVGNIECLDGGMELAQENLSKKVTYLLENNAFPILLGGGHDIAYAHYNGIKNHFGKDSAIGIINFDAHFDLRNNANGNHSGTPFYQIAQDCKNDHTPFHYLCLGIRKDANDKVLFEIAEDLGVQYIENKDFARCHAKLIVRKVLGFLRELDVIYTTIDLDGFSSAFAPGTSAASPMGFSPSMVLDTLQMILGSKKLIGLDIAEMNPSYDIDHQTAKLGASLAHFIMHQIS